MIIEDRYLDVLRGVDSPTEAAVTDLWTGHWKCKHLDAASAAQAAQEANENFRRTAMRRIAEPPTQDELELLRALRRGVILEHNAWTWRFYERLGDTEWRAVSQVQRNLLWHWRQNECLALAEKFVFQGLKKTPIGYFKRLMLSPVSAAWLDAHYPNG